MIEFPILSLVVVGSVALASAGNGPGDGTCDGTCCSPNPACPHADGDGICNGQDPDYKPHYGFGPWARFMYHLFGPGLM